ncbi:iron chelate uptake ABC transporter family permease subunit [Gordonia sp. SID5947]|uniref:FecCD family ABC transporter permease n=1 Tax=Gordonia sp. SID5947 TaxID=2690315 RepID=UPI00136D4EDF|nr:iron chelate uptake ABC transporter family permease subunit [Gordonia sp. SID5947]MYR08352.1 iron chelate uptake ABC transporter family permease subunit [Gordonia sp. SID5947]
MTTDIRPGPTPEPEAPQRTRRRVLRVGSSSWVIRPRMLVTMAVAVALTLLLFLLSIGISDYPMSPVDVARVLLGGGTRIENVVVFDVSLPRALVSLLVGFGFGMAGALTQLIARNPLATPDILGITAGASAAAVAAIAFSSTWGAWLAGLGVPAAALIGGFATAIVMYVLAWPGRSANVGIDPFRLVIIGVGVTWMLQALTSYMLTRAQIADAARAQTWLVGSVSQVTWSDVWPAAIAVGVGVVAVIGLSRAIGILGLGPDVARGLGVNAGRVTTFLLVIAVVVAALCVSAAGPIAFVALLAPQIALRLTGTPLPTPLASGIVGGILVLGGDLLCRTLLPGGLPVGIVTAAIGGPCLIYLMIAMSRKATV